jgi:hypothetical protein
MPRYVLRGTVACTPNSGQPQSFGTNTRIADAAHAQAGDVVCDQLALAPNHVMAPLDQAALNLILARVDAGNWQNWFTSIVSG